MKIYTQDDKPMRLGNEKYSTPVFINGGYYSNMIWYSFEFDYWVEDVKDSSSRVIDKFEWVYPHKVFKKDDCDHEIVDARNIVVASGRVCVKCNKVFE